MNVLSSCPRCNAPRGEGPECPRCGVIYAKAHGAAVALEVPEPLSWTADEEDALLEHRLRLFAIPCALLAGRLLVASSVGRFFLRTFLSMWVHESGHAIAAWLCAFPAFPGPWFTPIASERSLLFAFALAAGLAAAAARAFRSERWLLFASCCALLALQFAGTLLLRPPAARALIYFGGDAGCLFLGALLMASVYARKESSLRRGWLRWGFLCIGAASFADSFEQWWSARRDPDRIPFGMNEGRGLSDPSVLAETYGWSEADLVHRYVALGLACLFGLALLYLAHARGNGAKRPDPTSAHRRPSLAHPGAPLDSPVDPGVPGPR